MKPKQTAGSAVERSALKTCVCDGAHHWLYYPSPGQDRHESVSVFVLKSLCLSLVWRSVSVEEHRPRFHPLTQRQEEKKCKEWTRKETIGEKEQHQRARQDSTFRVPGVLHPFCTPPYPFIPCSPLLGGCNQEGQIKGAGGVSLQRFSSQSCQSVAKSSALGGDLAPLHYDEG